MTTLQQGVLALMDATGLMLRRLDEVNNLVVRRVEAEATERVSIRDDIRQVVRDSVSDVFRTVTVELGFNAANFAMLSAICMGIGAAFFCIKRQYNRYQERIREQQETNQFRLLQINNQDDRRVDDFSDDDY